MNKAIAWNACKKVTTQIGGMAMNLRDRYRLSLLAISLAACPLLVSFAPLVWVDLDAIAQTTTQVSDKQAIALTLQKSIARELKAVLRRKG